MSTAPKPQKPPPIPSDARLVWMASERATPLFRTLARTRSFDYLVVLLAILPAVLVLFATRTSTFDAAVALLALQTRGVSFPVEVQAIINGTLPLGAITPSAIWLTAGGMTLSGPGWAPSMLAASLIGGVAAIPLLWLLMRELGGRRVALWTVLLTAFHPAMMATLLTPVPISIALAGSLAALWGHLRLAEGGSSRWVAPAAIIVGVAAALLVAGPVGSFVPLLISVDAFFRRFTEPRPSSPRSLKSMMPGARLSLRLLGAVGGVGLWFLLNGWIPNPVLHVEGAPSELHDPDFGFGISEFVAETMNPQFPIPDFGHAYVLPLNPLWGLALLGLWRVLRQLVGRGGPRWGRNGSRFLLLWLVLSGAMVFWRANTTTARFDPLLLFAWTGLAILIVALAAVAIEAASRRTVGGAWVLLAVLAPISWRLGALIADVSLSAALPWLLGGIAIFIILWFATRLLRAMISGPSLRRGFLMITILAVGIFNAADGLSRAFRDVRSEPPLAPLMAKFRETRPRNGVVLLAKSPPPARLIYALRGIFPRIPMVIAPSLDEALDQLPLSPAPGNDRLFIAAWGLAEAIGSSSTAIHPVGEPMVFEEKPLLLYVANAPLGAP